jgi:hypothetical protein
VDDAMTRARVDANQPKIVAALRKMGASVLHLHTLGDGAPDLLIGMHGINKLVELKDGTKPPSARKLTPDETKFHAEWRGQVAIINSVDEAIAFIVAWSD